MSALESLRSRLSLNTTLVAVVARTFISGLEQSMIGVVFQPFVLSLGASVQMLGVFTSLGTGFGGLIPTLAFPWGGWIADQRGRKVVLLAASSCAIGAFSLYAVSGWFGTLLLLFPAIVLLGISQVYQPVNQALVGEAVGAGNRGSAYSLIQIVATAPGIVVPILAGVIADKFGFTFIFPVVVVFELIAFFIIFKYLRENRKTNAVAGGWQSVLKFMRVAWIPPRDLKWFFLAIGMDMFAWGMGFGILYGLLRQEYGFSTTQLGIMSSVSSITWGLSSLPIGRLVDRWGARPILILSEALSPPLMLLWMTQSRFEILAASMIIFALTAATWVPARNVYVTQTVEPARRGEIFGRLSAFSGLLGFPAASIGGFLFTQFGFAAPFVGNLVFAMVTLAILIFLVPTPHPKTSAALEATEA